MALSNKRMDLMGLFVLSYVVNLDMMGTRNGMFKSWFPRRLTDVWSDVRSRFDLSGKSFGLIYPGRSGKSCSKDLLMMIDSNR